MTDNELTIECARLDGWEYDNDPHSPEYVKHNVGVIFKRLPPYLTSRDAIIPVIEKNIKPDAEYNSLWWEFFNALDEQDKNEFNNTSYLFAPPRQLAIALIKAVGKWKE